MTSRQRAAAAAIVGIAFLLRVFRLGEQELWYDEAFSFHMATTPTGLWDALRLENSPPLYYLLLRAWVAVMGTSESAIRLLSACFGTLGVGAAIVAGRRLFNIRVGLWAGAVMALSPIHIYYSQEARGYTVLICALLVTYIFLVRALEHPSPGRWVVTGLAAVVAVYTHYGAIIGLLPTLLFLWAWPSQRALRARILGYLGAFALMTVCVVPWVIWCFVLMPHPFAVGDSMARVWERVPPALAIPKTLELFSIGHQADTYPNMAKVYPSLEFPPGLRLIALTVLSGLAVWASVPWADFRFGISELARRKALLWAWLVVPLAVLWVVSLHRPLYVVGRYDLIAFPAFVLLTGLALAKLQALPRVGWILTCITGLLLLSVLGFKLHLYYKLAASSSMGPSARQAAVSLASRAKSGDIVTFNMMQGAPILYYLHRLGYRWENRECANPVSGLRFGCRIFPPEDEIPFGLPGDPVPLSSFARELLFSLKGPENGLWVLVDNTYTSDALFLTVLANLNVTAVKVPVTQAVTLVEFHPR